LDSAARRNLQTGNKSPQPGIGQGLMLFGGGVKKLPAGELGPCDGVMLRSGFGSDHERQKFRVATLDGPKSFRILPHP